MESIAFATARAISKEIRKASARSGNCTLDHWPPSAHDKALGNIKLALRDPVMKQHKGVVREFQYPRVQHALLSVSGLLLRQEVYLHRGQTGKPQIAIHLNELVKGTGFELQIPRC